MTMEEGQEKKFNSTLGKLIEILDAELPSNALVDTIKRRFKLSLISDKTLLITEIGPEIYVYREEIHNNEWEKLIYTDWENKANQSSKDSNSIHRIIKAMRMIWEKYDDQEKKKITKLIRILLSEYAKFICLNV